MPSTKAKPRRPGRPPALRAVIELPCPPPPNSPALALARWRDQVAAALNAAAVPAMTGRAVAVTVHAAIPNTRRPLSDLTNMVIAELALHHIIEDADAVTDCNAKWDRAVPAGMMHLEIKQTRAPESRISADTRAKVSARVRERFAEAGA